LIHQQGGAKSKDQKGPNQVDETTRTQYLALLLGARCTNTYANLAAT
jgi:hypothetical protein